MSSQTKELLSNGEIVKQVARETLKRTFNFTDAQISTFDHNFSIILLGAIFEMETKLKQMQE